MNTERNDSETTNYMTEYGKFRGVFFFGIITFVLTVIFSPAFQESSWAGFCSTPNPSPANLTVYAGEGGSLTLTAVPYDKAGVYNWNFSVFPLPAWLTLSYDSNKSYHAILSVDPSATAGSTFSATVYVDSNKCYGGVQQFANVNIKVEPPPIMVISPSSSAVATEGTAFSRDMEVICRDGSTGAIIACPVTTWSASGLPSGLSIDSATGLISGIPAAGSGGESGFVYPVTVSYDVESVNFSLTVYPSTLPLTISSIGLPKGMEGQSYTYTVAGTGGVHPYGWSASGLPSGFSIGASTGTITGTASAGTNGTYNVTLTLKDKAGGTTVKTLGLIIEEAGAVTAGMDNYCVTPPFITQDIKSNLLLMIDNSASMYDLFYFDSGHGQSTDADYRAPFYCYDQTYSSGKNYPGYFKTADSGGNPVYYAYNFTGDYFSESAFPVSCTKRTTGSSGVGILCIDLDIGPPKKVTKFVASGNYLNWLTASKFDIEKKILTGGKYDAGSGDLVAESRGCVGRKYIKEAVQGDYVEGSATSLGITFGVKGPPNYYNASAPSQGGQTFLEIYYGDYIAGKCQSAADVFMDPTSGQLEQRLASAECLSYSKGDDYASKTQNSFIQSVQECWQYREDGTVGNDSAKGSVENFCPEIYNTKICSITNSTCTVDADCPAGESCVSGPAAIAAGNAALLCSSSYAGACYNGPTNPYTKFGFVASPVVLSGITYFTAEECIVAQHNKYCADFFHPPVVDPTDDPSETENYGNVPSLLGDLGVQGQLKYPVKTLTVRLRTSPGSGLIQQFSDNIRFGVMQFQSVGTSAECKEPAELRDLKCPKVCSNETSIYCSMPQDCPPDSPPAACIVSSNKDGAKVVGYLGDSVGNHTYGIVNTLDNLRADSWTPFAEGMYTAIAYFTRNTATDVKVANGPKRINADDFDTTADPIQSMCQKNHILLISDGMSTADQKGTVMSFVSNHQDEDSLQTVSLAGNIDAVPVYFGSINLDDLAYYAQNNNIFNPTAHPIDLTSTNITSRKPKDKITTHVVYTGTPYDSGCKYVKPDTGNACDPASDPLCKRICTSAQEQKSEVLMYRTAENGGGIYHLAQDADTLEAALENVLISISRSSSSGTAASVLASGEGSGANIIQAVFYPLMKRGDLSAKWAGRLTNLWYYVDPFFATSAIYEDSHKDNKLDLSDDMLVSFFYDDNEKKTKAELWKDGDGDLVPDTVDHSEDFEFLNSLWEAGFELWKRDLATDPRRIKTHIDGTNLINFSEAGAATFRPYLRAADDAESLNIIKYVNGFHIDGYRLRTVGVDLSDPPDGDYDDTVGGVSEAPKVWKLGDVIQSTPRVASWIRLNTYHLKYNDGTYGEPGNEASLSNPADETHYITSAGYRGRGMVFAGANDGMLHAFKLGNLETFGSGVVKAELSGTDLGKEMWAFIPKNVLPYLKYTADPNYCHIYAVDLAPYIFDASIGADLDMNNDGTDDQPDAGCNSSNYWKCVKTAESWRTIIIGGMRLGGGCRKSDGSCTDCVKTPGVDLNGNGVIDTGTEETSLGLSSYFALDITDTLNNPAADPKLLWEFTDEGLGFSTSGPVIVKISTKVGGDVNGDSRQDELDPADTLSNGKWFAVFASGPTGPLSTADHQFLGRSDQALKLFILELKSGNMINRPMDTAIANAFGGSMINATDDVDKYDYQDDVFYVPYVKREGSAPDYTWTDGGVLRVSTHGDLNPMNWTDSKLIDGIGPVTSATARLHDARKSQHWVYFGTGRYYFEKEPPDDPEGANRIFGVKDPCFTGSSTFFASPCPAALTLADLDSVDNIAVSEGLNPDSSSFKGWYINLDGTGTGIVDDPDSGDPDDTIEVNFRSERMITDPLALTGGVVFFTTFQPRDNVCEPGGRSYIWAPKYNTGGDAGALLKGKALLQVSTGEIKQLDLADAFSEKDGRRTAEITGVPPIAQGLSILSSPPPVKRVIHMHER